MQERISDIRVYKTELREKYKSVRKNMTVTERTAADKAILNRLQTLRSYKYCKTVLCYVSTPIEVDTRAIISAALQQGKQVAVPYCIPNTRQMEFYLINSLDELQKGAFSVDEPNPQTAQKLNDCSNSVCLVPGLCFDKFGYRLGYGKGYYDRFLNDYNGSTIGICYQNCINNRLITGRFDKSCSVVVTDKQLIFANRAKRQKSFAKPSHNMRKDGTDNGRKQRKSTAR